MKRMIQLAVCLVLLLATTFPVVASPLSTSVPCNPAFVQQNGNKITVLPTGNTNTGDTVNLQCAFDAATKHGSELHLISGTYRTAQIVINNFDGRFTGAGKDKTHIYNLPDLKVTPVDMYINPPSATNPWPSLFSFVNGKIYVANLDLHIKGATPTVGWTIFGIDPPLKELALGIAFLGIKTDAYVENILVEGEPLEGSLFGYNLINGVFFEGFIGQPSSPISGSFQVHNSIFRNVGSGTPIYNISKATVVSSHNTYQNVLYGMDSNNMVNSSLLFSHNDVNADTGFYMFSDIAEDGSSYLISNNTFKGNNGISFENIFGKGNHCLIVGNSLKDITGIGIYLGPDTKGCLVAGSNVMEDVVDNGTGNIIVGGYHLGTGVFPAIRSLMKRYR